MVLPFAMHGNSRTRTPLRAGRGGDLLMHTSLAVDRSSTSNSRPGGFVTACLGRHVSQRRVAVAAPDDRPAPRRPSGAGPPCRRIPAMTRTPADISRLFAYGRWASELTLASVAELDAEAVRPARGRQLRVGPRQRSFTSTARTGSGSSAGRAARRARCRRARTRRPSMRSRGCGGRSSRSRWTSWRRSPPSAWRSR